MNTRLLIILSAAVLAAGMFFGLHETARAASLPEITKENTMDNESQYEIAVLAAGCFWCVESDLAKIPGVADVISGYTGGSVENPTYEQVSGGDTGHREAVLVRFDPTVTSYEKILDAFWRLHDPTDNGGSFGDRGFQYTSAVFYLNDTQKEIAEASRDRLNASGRFKDPAATRIIPFADFHEAEDDHQNYSVKNPVRYKGYRIFSGRDRFIEKYWKDAPREGNSRYVRPSDTELKRKLTPLQYTVMRENGTEPPFDNKHWDNKKPGIYVDAATGEPLFSSGDKYDSGTGWPSFVRALVPENIVEREDRSLFSVRTEVRSKHGDSHLGHVFPDGPEPTGLRYCINSAALKFIPAAELEKHGYGEFRPLFE